MSFERSLFSEVANTRELNRSSVPLVNGILHTGGWIPVHSQEIASFRRRYVFYNLFAYCLPDTENIA